MRIPVRRWVVKNAEPWLLQVPEEAQVWSMGTSGQCEALADVILDDAQSKLESARQRSEVSKNTWAAAWAVLS
ncbi:hypothetical protein SO3561_10516 [Streptomyces olivochromogenes]|uniref:Uncharacterized protein n=1 Tax=Streptomyces olivochromogenes TaxID=1963 RepID=A0A286PHB2_STROL|nr:hypothetical protein SO3561_10516 [Streptomyces olivochromogenes]